VLRPLRQKFMALGWSAGTTASARCAF